MTFNEYLELPSSKKITMLEIDTPISVTWINYQPGIWFSTLTPGSQLVEDDNGNFGYWGDRNDTYYNIQSLNVSGEQYVEVASIAAVIATEKTWFYDTATTNMYIRFDDWNPPEYYGTVAPGAVIGFTNSVDTTTDNYFEDVYYEPRLLSVPNLSKKKDALFFGILQYQGGSVTLNDADGFFDDFAQRNLYNQPLRLKLSFEGLSYADAVTVYSGKVEDFAHDLTTFKVNIADSRKQLSRQLPINKFDQTTYPSLADNLVGVPIPIAFGSVIKSPAYKTSSGNWKFADTTDNAVDSGILVYNADGGVFGHGGTETDGTFTGANTDERLTVTFTQSTVQNGLAVIRFVLATFEDIAFTSANYDTTEWNAEQGSALNTGLWIGRGNLLTSVDIIEKVCTENQGVFDVLADGRFTFRTFDADRTPSHDIGEDELLRDTSVVYPSKEYLSSATIAHSQDLKEKEFQLYTNDDFETEVVGRYGQHKDFIKPLETCLTSATDAATLSDKIMEQSKFIFPTLSMVTKTQNIGLRILDNLMYTYARQNGKEIIARSRYQTLGINLDLSAYEMSMTIKQIREDAEIYGLEDGGDSTTTFNIYDGGDSTTTFNNLEDGGAA